MLALALLYQLGSTIHDYFIRWARSPQVASSFATGATEIAEYLRSARPTGSLYVSSKNRPTVQALAPDASATAHWFDPSEILPFPTDASRDSYYFFDLSQASLLEGFISSVGEQVLDADDRNAQVDVARGYRVPAGAAPSFPAIGSEPVSFGGAVGVAPVYVGPDPDEAGSVAVVLALRALRASPGYLSLAVRAVDAAGQVWAQRDGLGDDLTAWRAGQRALTLHRLHVYRAAPAGPLTVRVRVYDLAARRPLARDDGQGDELVAGAFAVPPGGLPDPVAPWLEPSRPVASDAPNTPIHLIRAGIDTDAAVQGTTLSASVVWERTASIAPGTHLAVELRDPLGTSTALFEPPAGGLAPPPLERAPLHRPMLDRRTLTMSSRWPPGRSVVQAVVRDGAGATLERVALATLEVRELHRERAAPPIERPIRATFADGIRLLGLASASPWDAQRATVLLVWRADAAPRRRYTVFTHLLDGAGLLVAQHDGPPATGAWPTDAWIPGQVVVDEHAIPLVPGELERVASIEIGLYDEETLVRLPPIAVDGALSRDDAIRLPLRR